MNWKLPHAMVLAAYAVSQIYICRTIAINWNACPCEFFTGVSVNFKKKLEQH
jgi:hypothetical protein